MMTFPTPADNAWRPSPLLGRDALLRSLESRLSTEKRLLIGVDPALACPRGVGRTRLVMELVQRVASQDSQVVILNGTSSVTWHDSLLRAAQQLPLRQTTFRKASDLISSLRSWLNSHDNWILVADSVVDSEPLHELLDEIHTGHLIAILNQPNMSVLPGWPAAVPLGALSAEDALRVLQQASGRDWKDTQEVVAASQLVHLLERNPLCCELAGRTLSLAGIEPGDYLQWLRTMAAQTPVRAALTLLLANLEDRDATALNLLASGVALGPGPLTPAVMQEISGHPAGSAAWQLLLNCGLLRWVNAGQSVEIPAVDELKGLLSTTVLQQGAIQARSALPSRAVRNRLHEHVCGEIDREVDPCAAQRVALGKAVSTSSPVSGEQLNILREAADSALDLLLPRVSQQLWQRVLDQATRAATEDAALLEPLVSLGTANVLAEQFQQARRCWRQAVELCHVKHPMLTELLLGIAEIDVNENRLERAQGRLAQVAQICQSLPASMHQQLLAGQLSFLKAGVSLGQDQPVTAREQFQLALELRSPILRSDHSLLMSNRLMLARTEFLLKDYSASERILKDEVTIRAESTRVSETEQGVAWNFLAEQYYLSGRLSDAEPMYERALQLRRATLVRGHRQIGEMTNRLAVIKSARGSYKEADALFRESLATLEQNYGEDHPEVARVLNDLAESLFSQNKIEPARRLLERALNIQERALRTNDTRLGRTRCNLAAVYVARGRFAEAVRLYERDVAERLSHASTNQASLATSLNNLAEALRSLGQYGAAEERLKQSLAIREKMVGPSHPQVAQLLNNLGYLYLQVHRFLESRDCLQRALAIRQSCLAADHPHVATTLSTLAEVCFTTGQYIEARSLYAQAMEICLAAYGERHPQVASLQICSARNELRLGHVGRAELMLLRGQGTIVEVLGADHRMSAKVLLGLAELAHAERRYEAAFPLLERGLAIQYGTMSSQRLEIAETLHLITQNLVARGLPAEALPRIVEAVEIQHATLGANHVEMIPNWLLLGRIQQQLGHGIESEEALRSVIQHANPLAQSSLVEEALELLPDVLVQVQKYDEAAEHLTLRVATLESSGTLTQLLSALSQLAGVHYLRQTPAEAALVMDRCVSLSEQLHGPDSAETAKHLDNLAGVRFLLGQYECAESPIRRAIGILERERPVRIPALTKARENYIQLLRQTDRTLEADQLALLVTTIPAASEPEMFSGSHVLDDL